MIWLSDEDIHQKWSDLLRDAPWISSLQITQVKLNFDMEDTYETTEGTQSKTKHIPILQPFHNKTKRQLLPPTLMLHNQ
jgi:hypothetical protein